MLRALTWVESSPFAKEITMAKLNSSRWPYCQVTYPHCTPFPGVLLISFSCMLLNDCKNAILALIAERVRLLVQHSHLGGEMISPPFQKRPILSKNIRFWWIITQAIGNTAPAMQKLKDLFGNDDFWSGIFPIATEGTVSKCLHRCWWCKEQQEESFVLLVSTNCMDKHLSGNGRLRSGKEPFSSTVEHCSHKKRFLTQHWILN